ncbi:hypothetical protein P3X46_005585 [Hevea brasiliensis]|uniref:Pectinesterase inhibitor domain-containing protein n=1 Tax=Hevea brasiliensis TaxID=3981 RepID=A0ABQ9N2W2_HEVBR|nr:uncharacterized protein LOC110636205 [Hevea brasiliensis]KAJ9186027.1 hypothetical protein P3X46_005585 [Hevea brasiliensis]
MSLAHCYFSVSVALLVIFLLINPAFSDKKTQEMIDKVCRQMEEYGFCNQTFNENLKTKSTNYVDLTQITIDQVTRNATNTYEFVLQLLQNTSIEALKNALRVCESSYQVVLGAFQDALRSFNQQDYDSMIKYERVTPKAQGGCDACFNTPPIPANPLADRNRQIRILIAMAIVTGHELVTL